jgi:hypothetical protein
MHVSAEGKALPRSSKEKITTGNVLQDGDAADMPDAFKSHFAEVNGVRLHCVSLGQRKLMMFVHGFPEYWTQWENQS